MRKWRRTLGFAQAKLSQKTTWRIVQKLQNNDLPARILSTPVTRTPTPLAIIHHCPKITTGNSVALSIRPVRQGNPLLFPQQTTQLSFYETRILVRMPVIRFRSRKTGCLPWFISTKSESSPTESFHCWKMAENLKAGHKHFVCFSVFAFQFSSVFWTVLHFLFIQQPTLNYV